MIHREVSGFLELRWREFVNESCKYPGQNRGATYVNASSDKFEEFILWVAEAVESETSTGGTTVQRTIGAIQRHSVEMDSHSGGLRLEVQWGKLNTFFTSIDIRNVSKDEFEALKRAVLEGMRPKGGDWKAGNFIKKLYNLGPGKYRMIGDLPGDFKWVDWWVPMIREANHLQKLGEEIKKAEGSIEFTGYSRSSFNGDMNQNRSPGVVQFNEAEEMQSKGFFRGAGQNQQGRQNTDGGLNNKINNDNSVGYYPHVNFQNHTTPSIMSPSRTLQKNSNKSFCKTSRII